MALALNKTTLKQQRDQLKTFKRFLPSLDLKRQQLLAALKVARRQLAEVRQEFDAVENSLRQLYPLLGSSTVATRDLGGLVGIREVKIGEENMLGTTLPVAEKVEFETSEYSYQVMPFWVDLLVQDIRRVAELRVLLQVAQERVVLLEHASRRITQRVNLFEKVLIPQAEQNVRKIVIFLSDQERAAVVRSKIAKKKNSEAQR